MRAWSLHHQFPRSVWHVIHKMHELGTSKSSPLGMCCFKRCCVCLLLLLAYAPVDAVCLCECLYVDMSLISFRTSPCVTTSSLHDTLHVHLVGLCKHITSMSSRSPTRLMCSRMGWSLRRCSSLPLLPKHFICAGDRRIYVI
jgi:hypothetical protein